MPTKHDFEIFESHEDGVQRNADQIDLYLRESLPQNAKCVVTAINGDRRDSGGRVYAITIEYDSAADDSKWQARKTAKVERVRKLLAEEAEVAARRQAELDRAAADQRAYLPKPRPAAGLKAVSLPAVRPLMAAGER